MGQRIGIVGDLHENPLQLHKWIDQTKVDAVLQVGDFGCYEEEFAVPVWWVFGNREQESVIEKLKKKSSTVKNNYMINSGNIIPICGLDVLGICGAENPKGDGYIINFDEVIKDVYNRIPSGIVDILITHEPVTRMLVTSDYNGKLCYTCNDKLHEIRDLVEPKYAFSGHWHRNANVNHKGTDSYIIGIEPRDWLIFDVDIYKAGDYPLSTRATENFPVWEQTT